MPAIFYSDWSTINTLRLQQNGHHLADDLFKYIFLNENVWISIEISLKFVHKGPINNIPALVKIMAWRWPGDKPLSEPMMGTLPTHLCITQPQWVINGFTLIPAWISNHMPSNVWNEVTYPLHHWSLGIKFKFKSRLFQLLHIRSTKI